MKESFYIIKNSNSHAILIFDSGIGGLSVYKNIKKLLPNLYYIYTFDNIGFPYGEKSERFIIKRTIKIINTVQKQHSIKLVVVACNTASLTSLKILRKKFKFFIIGVIPAIKFATRLAKNKNIGLLATRVTINHIYTQMLIKRYARENQIMTLDSTELVRIAENKLHGIIVQKKLLLKIFQPWLYIKSSPSIILLGCTHFSFLKKELLNIFPKGTYLIDISSFIAYRIKLILKNKLYNINSSKKNIAYCLKFTSKTKKLIPVLQQYGFQKIKQLLL